MRTLSLKAATPADPTLHPRLTHYLRLRVRQRLPGAAGLGHGADGSGQPDDAGPGGCLQEGAVRILGLHGERHWRECERGCIRCHGAASNDVVFISETVNSSQVGNRLVRTCPSAWSARTAAYNSDLGFAGGSSWPVEPGDQCHRRRATTSQRSSRRGRSISTRRAWNSSPSPAAQPPGCRHWPTPAAPVRSWCWTRAPRWPGGGTAAGRRVMLPLGREGQSELGLPQQQRPAASCSARSPWGTGNYRWRTGKLLLVVADACSPTAQDSRAADPDRVLGICGLGDRRQRQPGKLRYRSRSQ